MLREDAESLVKKREGLVSPLGESGITVTRREKRGKMTMSKQFGPRRAI